MPGTIPDTGDRIADAKALGEGLMRGNRADLQLGYSWPNAFRAVVEHYGLDPEDPATLEVAVYLNGFAWGLTRPRVIEHFAAGIWSGAAEDRSRTYPAEAWK